MMLPGNFEKWDAETQAAVRYAGSKYRYISVSGHGYECYFPIGNDPEDPFKTKLLPFTITSPKEWTWAKTEPFLWRAVAAFIKYEEENK